MTPNNPESMRHRKPHAQSGGITILVALSLLVLLTIAAVSMSRNSFREVVISGTSRQGAMVRNAADAGIEWSVYWLTRENYPARAGTALKLGDLKDNVLLPDTTGTKAGIPWDVFSGAQYTAPATTLQADQSFSTVAGTTQGFSTALTRMGKVPTEMTSFGNRGGTKQILGTDKNAPDLWAVRSDGQLTVGSGVLATTFVHSKEAWISTPVAAAE